MEVLSVLIILLIIWLIVIQNKIIELSNSLKEFKNDIIRNSIYKKAEPPISSADNLKEPVSVSDIPDDIIFNRKKEFMPEEQPCEEIQTVINKTDRQPSDFEKIFLGNIFNKIGALAILIGIIIFIKLISPYIIFTPAIKIALGFLAGFGMIACALILHSKENLKNYSEVLLGTGFGALFITTYCASTLFNLFNLPTAFAVATALLIASFYLADKLKTVSMLAISLIAGYLNPFFIHHEPPVTPNFLMGYLIFVNLLSIFYTFRNQNRNAVNIVNLLMTLFTALIYFKGNNIIAPAILWIAYFIYDLISTTKNNTVDNKGLNYTNFAVFTILTLTVYSDIKTALIMLILGIAYALAAILKRNDRNALQNYIHLFLASTTLSVYFLTAYNHTVTNRVYYWAAEAALLAFMAYRYKYKALANWSACILSAAFMSMFGIDGVFAAKSIGNFTPVWNVRLLTFAPLIISSAFSHYFLKKSHDEKIINLSEFFNLACITLIYLYMGFELNDIINKRFIGANNSLSFIHNMTNIILGFAYTINLKRFHVLSNYKAFGILSAFIGIIALLSLLFTGMDYKPLETYIPVINLRSAAFFAAITASIMYAKWTKQEVYKYLAVALGYILIHAETTDIINKYFMMNAEYLISLSWILYAGIITSSGIFLNKKYLKLSGIALCILSILRIFIYDMANVDIMYKFIAFLTLGIILMILSYFYNKIQK